MTTPKTVRVRIACVVNECGEWNAVGNHQWNRNFAMAQALLFSPLGSALDTVFIEADVPLPEPTTVEGEVKP